MGLLAKLFGWKITCPQCGAVNAQDSFAGVHCSNRQCRNYDPQYVPPSLPMQPPATPSEFPYASEQVPRLGRAKSPRTIRFSDPLQIEYTNVKGERKTFVCERESLRRTESRISVRVEPAGIRIALALDRIGNLQEVQRALQALEPDFTDSISIVYKNFRGERKIFQAARKSVRFTGNHMSVCVAPKKKRIALQRDRIVNWGEVQRQIEQA